MSRERVMAFGREVRRRRQALNMSLGTLAEGAGLSGPYMGQIETGARRPRGVSLEAAFRVADGLGVELSEIVGFKGLSGPGIEAGRLVSALAPELRTAVLALLRGIDLGHE
ncbi:MAG TPA: helix-turn-helix transcriptional regulator [Polyangiaceae bacterium]|jgi:transcriptional regulator with XRE-family HTH domain|nr:helix-turn-helix transcriptional regulator [Polyangiaceae bacterium]